MINEANDKVLVIAFTNRLQSGKFLFSIFKNDPKTMADMLYKATKYMNVEDAMMARGGRLKKKERQDDPSHDRGRSLLGRMTKGAIGDRDHLGELSTSPR